MIDKTAWQLDGRPGGRTRRRSPFVLRGPIWREGEGGGNESRLSGRGRKPGGMGIKFQLRLVWRCGCNQHLVRVEFCDRPIDERPYRHGKGGPCSRRTNDDRAEPKCANEFAKIL